MAQKHPLVYSRFMTELRTTVDALPDRQEVIAAHKATGGRVAAVYPYHYPRALLRAFDILPVEVWGPPGRDPSPADAHVQPYVCTVIRCGLSLLLSGGLERADLIMVPHGCDSLQGMGSLLLDLLPPPQPVLTLYLPRGNSAHGPRFLAEELAALRLQLADITGKSPDDSALMSAILREEQADARFCQLLDDRPQLDLSEGAFYRLLRSREYLPAERFSAAADAALAGRDPARKAGVPIALSGIMAEPIAVLDAIDQAGGTVVADDLAGTGRRRYLPGSGDDPLLRLAGTLLGAPPCSTRSDAVSARVDHLLGLVRGRGAKAVIFYTVKFCEPELFYQPLLRKALDAAGIPSVTIEVDLAEQLPHQAITRVEALLETVQ